MTTELEPFAPEGVKMTATGLIITDPNMPYEQAETIGHVLGRAHMSVRFAIGDWLLFIEAVYPEKWSQLAEVLAISERTCRDYMRVSQRVPHSIRRPEVEWSAHRAVAALPPPAQKEWLKKVEVEKMPHHALRDALRNGDPKIVQTHCRCCGREYDA